jgi:hypothetical protein
MFKAILSKNKTSIYFPKERNKPYMTLSLTEAMKKCRFLFPDNVTFDAVSENIDMIKVYRDNVIHFYNEKDFEIMLYSLFQTSIQNYRELYEHYFGKDLADEICIKLLPLSFRPPLDPIQIFSKFRGSSKNPAIGNFLAELSSALTRLEEKGIDTGRLMTLWDVKIESCKKITNADILVGITGDESTDAIVIERKSDPNLSHPLLASDIYSTPKKKGIIGALYGIPFNSYVFQAILAEFKLKEKPLYTWKDVRSGSYRYSRELVAYIKKLSEEEVQRAISNYKKHKVRGK